MWRFLLACRGIEGDVPGECVDGVDNDHNGWTDCRDGVCSRGAECNPTDTDEHGTETDTTDTVDHVC